MADLFDVNVGGVGFHFTSHLIALAALFIACFAIAGYITFRKDSIPGDALKDQDVDVDDIVATTLTLSGDATVSGDLTVSGSINRDSVKYNFVNARVAQNIQNDGTAASGVDTEINRTTFDNGARFFIQNIGTQTIVAPVISGVKGFDFSGDATDNDGKQGIVLSNETDSAGNFLVPGNPVDTKYRSFTVGTSPAFYCSFTVEVTDVSGTDDCAFGFREVENFTANLDDYTDLACLNIISGAINIETILANAATTTTDTTDTLSDAGIVKLTVLVSATGVVTYLIDGAAPTATAAYTFASGTVVSPFFYMLQATELSPIIIRELEYGHQ